MDRHLEDKLYEKFSHLYRERKLPLESSKMGWGFGCEGGWFKIIYEMSKNIEKISSHGEFAPAVTEISKHEDGTLYVEIRNLTPPVADIIATSRERSRLTCELCSYSPAFCRPPGSFLEGHVACGRCVSKGTRNTKDKRTRPKRRQLRAPDTIIIKR